jgi:predicted anti-sigma-YlaC factor YlaD
MSRVFVIATLVALVHAMDDAFVHRGPGLGLGQHALAGLVALAAGVGAIVLFPRLRPGLQAALSFSFGLFALVNGAMHIGHLDAGGPAGADLTGVAAAVAGVVLIALAAVIPWRHRGEGTWRSRAVAVPAGVLAVSLIAPNRHGHRSDPQVARAGRLPARRRLRGRRLRGVRRPRSRRLVPPV